RATWTTRIQRARKGLFTPLSTQETLALPGAVGGANWGNTAANPAKGIVYVISQDFPSFYQLSEQPPAPTANALARMAVAPEQRGRMMYEQTCQACHGADRSGSATGPSLSGLATRLQFEDFKQVVLVGRGHMPAFPSIDDEGVRGLWTFVADRATSG